MFVILNRTCCLFITPLMSLYLWFLFNTVFSIWSLRIELLNLLTLTSWWFFWGCYWDIIRDRIIASMGTFSPILSLFLFLWRPSIIIWIYHFRLLLIHIKPVLTAVIRLRLLAFSLILTLILKNTNFLSSIKILKIFKSY
jgi:hypothetical protein